MPRSKKALTDPTFVPPSNSARVELHINFDLSELAAWPPDRAAVFMAGLARVISASRQDTRTLS